jgi:hypothetical protein
LGKTAPTMDGFQRGTQWGRRTSENSASKGGDSIYFSVLL